MMRSFTKSPRIDEECDVNIHSLRISFGDFVVNRHLPTIIVCLKEYRTGRSAAVLSSLKFCTCVVLPTMNQHRMCDSLIHLVYRLPFEKK
ncbi:hypothetical protein TNCV_629891 [Trichonephila clavipes]|nr:hypothetical protein TNCV_629891 [Trichonephila clavipes]